MIHPSAMADGIIKKPIKIAERGRPRPTMKYHPIFSNVVYFSNLRLSSSNPFQIATHMPKKITANGMPVLTDAV